MLNLIATISVAALSVVHGGIVTSGAVPAVTFHRDNHAKRAAMGYAAASARLRRAVLEAKSAAWDEEEVGWDKQDEESAHQAQTAARELLAFAENTAYSPDENTKSESSTGTLRGSAATTNHTQIEHPVYQVGKFGLSSKLLEVDTPDTNDDDSVDEPHPYVHYKKIVSMIKDAKNEIKAAKWDEDHEEAKDSTAREEGKKAVFAAGKLVSVLAQVISWAKAHQAAENSTSESAPSKSASKSSVPTKANTPPRALTAHSNSSTKKVTINASVSNAKNATTLAAPNATTVAAPNVTANKSTSSAVASVTNKTSTATRTATPAPKASSSSSEIENEATKQAEVVESSSKKIAAAVNELDAATDEIRKDDPAVEDVMSELDKAAGKLENATTRISLKIIAHKLVLDTRTKAKEAIKKDKSLVNTSTANTTNKSSIAHEASASVEKTNATDPTPKVNVTQPVNEVPNHQVKVTPNVSVPKSFVKQSPPVKQKTPEEQMDELLNAEAVKQEAKDDNQDQEQAKAQSIREKQEASELKAEEAEIEKEQEIEAEKEADEKKAAADQLEQEEQEADEELKAESEERKAKALMRLAKKRRAKLSKGQKVADSGGLGF